MVDNLKLSPLDEIRWPAQTAWSVLVRRLCISTLRLAPALREDGHGPRRNPRESLALRRHAVGQQGPRDALWNSMKNLCHPYT